MHRVYRLTLEKHAKDAADLLDGEGARIHGGRWNHKGTPLVYAASQVSLAALESLVHAGDTLPERLVLVAYEVPDEPEPAEWSVVSLPADWRTYPFSVSTQDLGTAWAAERKDLAVKVPSAVIPLETNCLINPNHPAITKVKATVLGPFALDRRLRGKGVQ